jgi:hypothetical protein
MEDVLMDVKRRKEDEREKGTFLVKLLPWFDNIFLGNLLVRSPRHGNGSPSDGNADRRGHNRVLQ